MSEPHREVLGFIVIFGERLRRATRQRTQAPLRGGEMVPIEFTEDRAFAPRRGRAFSFRLPQAQPQRRWMEHLPWDVMAHVRDDRLADFRAALGCSSDTAESDERFAQALDDFTHGRLLLRVIELCPRYPVPPGETIEQCRARLDRWLPPHWEADLEAMTLSWTRPTRFACPAKNVQLEPHALPFITEPPADCKALQDSFTRWLPSGLIWVFLRPMSSRTARKLTA